MVDIDALAAALREAQQRGTPCAPLTERADALTVEDAYAIQQLNLERRGSPLIGHKIGLTSHAIQSWLGVDQPDFGGLLADMQVLPGGVVSCEGLLQPRAEAEIAFVLAEDLEGGPFGPADIIAATDYLLPAIEIIDSRIADWKISYRDTIADNASSGLFVLGADPAPLTGAALELAGMALRKNNRVVSTGAGAA